MRSTTVYVSAVALCAVVSFMGCSRPVATSLIGGLTSGISIAEFKAKVDSGNNWQETHQSEKPTGSRPGYDLAELTGTFRHLNQRGVLTATFYNDRLMKTEFEPEDTEIYLKAMTAEIPVLPKIGGENLRIGSHTLFSYYVHPRGKLHFIWQDEQLNAEWRDWVSKYS